LAISLSLISFISFVIIIIITIIIIIIIIIIVIIIIVVIFHDSLVFSVHCVFMLGINKYVDVVIVIVRLIITGYAHLNFDTIKHVRVNAGTS